MKVKTADGVKVDVLVGATCYVTGCKSSARCFRPAHTEAMHVRGTIRTKNVDDMHGVGVHDHAPNPGPHSASMAFVCMPYACCMHACMRAWVSHAFVIVVIVAHTLHGHCMLAAHNFSVYFGDIATPAQLCILHTYVMPMRAGCMRLFVPASYLWPSCCERICARRCTTVHAHAQPDCCMRTPHDHLDSILSFMHASIMFRPIFSTIADDAVGTVRFIGEAAHGKIEGKKRVGVELSTVRRIPVTWFMHAMLPDSCTGCYQWTLLRMHACIGH
jgi:hypothetical protein